MLEQSFSLAWTFSTLRRFQHNKQCIKKHTWSLSRKISIKGTQKKEQPKLTFNIKKITVTMLFTGITHHNILAKSKNLRKLTAHTEKWQIFWLKKCSKLLLLQFSNLLKIMTMKIELKIIFSFYEICVCDATVWKSAIWH